MEFGIYLYLLGVFLSINVNIDAYPALVTSDDLENHISPEDLQALLNMFKNNDTLNNADFDLNDRFQDITTSLPIPSNVDCYGLGPVTSRLARMFNMKPDDSESINTQFFFSSRKNPKRVQIMSGEQFGLEWVDFNANRKTVMIVHGFMSFSNAPWVTNMTEAFLEWGDVNVITVDWSGGGNTWKYWRAVANTRTVGSDITTFLKQLIDKTGANVKDFHFVGHSLGAHIVSYVSYHLGRVFRITGLDPAQPCFETQSDVERLDVSDADFVDVIHTNGRLVARIGLGKPDPDGHADFYPNGGMKQPGCGNNTDSVFPISFSKVQQAICSHGRSYLLFTESLKSKDCSFRAYRWNLTYEGVNASLKAACDRVGSCSEMGIRAVGMQGLPRATGSYFVLTTDKEPYCPTEAERRSPQTELLNDLRRGYRLDRSAKLGSELIMSKMVEELPTTTQQSFFSKWFG